ncbi:Putative ammonia monooxygenase [Nitrincola nitratireducens]|uniref:Putative ammonia monooxygenase n=1 Tax=Nitrincola nitratireducens TaxID=1229521 RepID=W9V6R9_9GAMM|nr:Putative ammonia monooxygenase [Nitrincola nitratireducens]
MRLAKLIKAITFISIASVGGWVVTLTGIPIGWLIGSLVVTILCGALGIHAPSIQPVMSFVRSSIGALLGASVTLSFFSLLIEAWGSIIFLISSMALTIGLGYLLLRRFFKLDAPTSMLCSLPGGMTEISLLSDRTRCDQAQVAIAHLFRVALAVLTLPFIISLFSGVEFTHVSNGEQVLLMSATDWGWLLICILAGVYCEKRFNLQVSVILIPFVLCAGLHLTGVATLEIPSGMLL